MSLWDERAARNEALFREVNERVEEIHDHYGSGSTAEFVCECADDECLERLTVPVARYERVRSSPVLFCVAPGHERVEVEHVIEQGDGFLIVKKDNPTSAQIAEETDPRG
jgi:hypothetical protein